MERERPAEFVSNHDVSHCVILHVNNFLYDNELLGDRNCHFFSFLENMVYKVSTHLYRGYGMKE